MAKQDTSWIKPGAWVMVKVDVVEHFRGCPPNKVQVNGAWLTASALHPLPAPDPLAAEKEAVVAEITTYMESMIARGFEEDLSDRFQPVVRAWRALLAARKPPDPEAALKEKVVEAAVAWRNYLEIAFKCGDRLSPKSPPLIAAIDALRAAQQPPDPVAELLAAGRAWRAAVQALRASRDLEPDDGTAAADCLMAGVRLERAFEAVEAARAKEGES